jgi:hypothetical protein
MLIVYHHFQCDETKPVCQNCARHETGCSYKLMQPAIYSGDLQGHSPIPSHATSSTSNIPTVHQTLQLCVPQNPMSVPELDIADLELLHHYLTSTSYTLARHPILQTQWRVKATRFGFTSEFVLRAILAFSALHLSYMNPERKLHYISQADHHHEIAEQSVALNLPRLIQENGAAVHLFSVFTCFIACARPPKSDNLLMFQGGIVSTWLTTLRGFSNVAICAEDTFKAGPLAPMFFVGEQMARRRDRRAQGKIAVIEDLRKFVLEEVSDQEELGIYLVALDEINKSFAISLDENNPRSEIADVFTWPLVVPDKFLVLLGQHKPVALIIFAYYSVKLRQLEWAWWMEGWSRHLISGIYKHLDDRYRVWVRWPIEQIGWAPPCQATSTPGQGFDC